MCARANENDLGLSRVPDEKPIRFDVAFLVATPFPLERVPPLMSIERLLLHEQIHHLV